MNNVNENTSTEKAKKKSRAVELSEIESVFHKEGFSEAYFEKLLNQSQPVIVNTFLNDYCKSDEAVREISIPLLINKMNSKKFSHSSTAWMVNIIYESAQSDDYIKVSSVVAIEMVRRVIESKRDISVRVKEELGTICLQKIKDERTAQRLVGSFSECIQEHWIVRMINGFLADFDSTKSEIVSDSERIEEKSIKSETENESIRNRPNRDNGKARSKIDELKALIPYFTSLEKDIFNLKSTRQEMTTRISDLESSIKETECKLSERLIQIKELCDVKENIEKISTERLWIIEEKSSEILKLQSDLNNHKDVLNIFDDHSEKERAELLNILASKLRSEYMDFLEAEKMEMTVDLGENLRYQLSSVFKILEKNGISLNRSR